VIKKLLVRTIDWALIKLGPSPEALERNRDKMYCSSCPFGRQIIYGSLCDGKTPHPHKSINIRPMFGSSKIPDAEKSWPPKNKMWPPSNQTHKDSPRA
jgi:hypothetical protein